MHHRAASPDEPDVREADFLFVDPPDLSAWSAIRPTLEPRRPGGTLLWLPVLRRRARDEGAEALEDARLAGCRVATIGWDAPGRTVGCHLVYRLGDEARAALLAAARHVARVAGWTWHGDAA